MPYIGKEPADIIATAIDTTTGTFSGAVSAASVDADGGVTVDNITIDGTEIDLSSGDLTIDVASKIILDADSSGSVEFHDGGTKYGTLSTASNHMYITSSISDGDIVLQGSDGGSGVTALTLDMSEAGDATFNSNIRTSAIIVQSGIGSGGIARQTTASGSHAYTPSQFRNSSGTVVGSIGSGTSATSFNTTSDYRLKESITYDFDATTRLKQLKPARFNFIVDADNTVDGFIAHEVSSIVPEAITGVKVATEKIVNVVLNADGSFLADNISEKNWTEGKANKTYAEDTKWVASKTVPKYQQLDQAKLIPLLTKTIQELEARIETLEAEVKALKGE